LQPTRLSAADIHASGAFADETSGLGGPPTHWQCVGRNGSCYKLRGA